MPDGGEPLRGKLKESYDRLIVGTLLGQYARIQRALSSDVDSLLALGIDDWRMAVFPDLYDDLVHDKGLLERERLTTTEIETLWRSGEDVRRLCGALADFKIPETLEHCDFHDNNVLADAKGFLINDWGDAVISHPFFSLVGFLDSAARNHGMDVGSPVYEGIKDAYFAWSVQRPYRSGVANFHARTRLSRARQDHNSPANELDACIIVPAKAVGGECGVDLRLEARIIGRPDGLVGRLGMEEHRRAQRLRALENGREGWMVKVRRPSRTASFP
jgi:hypothetical protein